MIGAIALWMISSALFTFGWIVWHNRMKEWDQECGLGGVTSMFYTVEELQESKFLCQDVIHAAQVALPGRPLCLDALRGLDREDTTFTLPELHWFVEIIVHDTVRGE